MSQAGDAARLSIFSRQVWIHSTSTFSSSPERAARKEKGSLYTRQERSRIVYSRKEEGIATKRWVKTTVELLVCRRQKSRKKGKGRDVILFFGDRSVYATLARIMAVWEGV